MPCSVRSETRRLAAAAQQRDERSRGTSRFEVLGRLAGGVSHDFANLLTVIIGSTMCALDDTPPDSPVRPHLEAIQGTAERAASMVRQLLAFSRRTDSPDDVTDVAQVLVGVEPLLARLVGEHITIRTSKEPGLWPVRVSSSQIEQVLLNLVVNARDAMSAGGVITIDARNLSARDASRIAGREVAASVAVTVSDTGAGMADDVRARAFQPFFTTKADSGGTGLGLATVQSIVEGAGGWAHLASTPGHGTAITFGLSRSVEPCARLAQPVSRAVGGSETLLLVEDEPGVRQLVKGMLESSGYRVLAAPAPSAAERLCAAFDGRIDLLLTDVVLPESSGFDLSHRLRGDRPDMRVMYISGFPEPLVREGGDVSGTHFLSKPFDRAALLAGVRRALDSEQLVQVAS
jgi:two-component system, cell cycle sensor histidine kinase and response regulator CckA